MSNAQELTIWASAPLEEQGTDGFSRRSVGLVTLGLAFRSGEDLATPRSVIASLVREVARSSLVEEDCLDVDYASGLVERLSTEVQRYFGYRGHRVEVRRRIPLVLSEEVRYELLLSSKSSSP